MSLSYKEALNRLKEGNARYVAEKQENPNNSQARRESCVKGQSPYAIILSCADSRVVPELTFDAGIEELFVVRVAGNVANTSSIASIEYAVAHLGVELIVVLGHESCGAVTAAIAGGDNGYNLNHLLAHVAPAIAKSEDPSVNEVVKVNASENASALEQRSAIISSAVASGKLKIVAGYYNLSSGAVDIL